MSIDKDSLKLAVNTLCRLVNLDGRVMAKNILGDPIHSVDNYKTIGAIEELNVLTLAIPDKTEVTTWFAKFTDAISSSELIPSRIIDLKDWNKNWSFYLHLDKKDLATKVKDKPDDLGSALLKERYEFLIQFLEDTMKSADQSLLDELDKFFENA